MRRPTQLRTKSLTRLQRTSRDGFPKAGELIEITNAHELEASDRAMVNMLYQHAHDSGRMCDSDAAWTIPLSDLRFASSHKGNQRVRDSLERILRVVVKVHVPEPDTGEPAYLLTHLFDFFVLPVAETHPKAIVRFGVPRKLQPILARSNRWGRIKTEVVRKMRGKYAITLYELAQLRTNMYRCVETFPIARFRDLLGVPPDAYKRGNDFVRYVIQPALLEVNGLSDTGVEMSLVRRNRTRFGPIETVTVAWWRKQDDEFRSVLRERQRPKLGRMARLRGEFGIIPPPHKRIEEDQWHRIKLLVEANKLHLNGDIVGAVYNSSLFQQTEADHTQSPQARRAGQMAIEQVHRLMGFFQSNRLGQVPEA